MTKTCIIMIPKRNETIFVMTIALFHYTYIDILVTYMFNMYIICCISIAKLSILISNSARMWHKTNNTESTQCVNISFVCCFMNGIMQYYIHFSRETILVCSINAVNSSELSK